MDVRVINKLERVFADNDGGLSVRIHRRYGEARRLIPIAASFQEEELKIVALIRELFSLIDVDGRHNGLGGRFSCFLFHNSTWL